jgi:predicted secreted hydrolase
MAPIKRGVGVLSVVYLCLILSSFSTNGSLLLPPSQTTSIQGITLHDDAFHGRGELPFIEWWYFDAKLDNGYSVVLGVHIINIFARGIVSTRLTIYQQDSVLLKSYAKYFLRDLSASSNVPSVYIQGHSIIQGTYDSIHDRFLYNVTMTAPNGAISLQYIGCTKGWKRQQQTGDWWAVVLPRATITGTITVNDTTTNVTGTGYHDHNWGIGPRIALHFGWFWGTCSSSTYTITWAEIQTTRMTQVPIMVINTQNAGYLEIPSETIWFNADNISFNHLRRIPLFFVLATTTDHVFILLNMEVISIDHTEMLGFIKYWRYHVRCTGTIVVNDHFEQVNSTSIMEYLRFR